MTDAKEQELVDKRDEAYRKWDEADGKRDEDCREWAEACRELREYRADKAPRVPPNE